MLSTLLNALSDKIKTSFLLKLPDSKEIQFGKQDPSFQIVVKNHRGLKALKSRRELQICEAYMHQDLDLEGSFDMMKLLEITRLFSKEHPVSVWASYWLNCLSKQVRINKKSIAKHYEFDHEFYMYFLDKTRAYSHGIFLNDKESLEVANNRKLEFAMNACKLNPGARILDLGAGWGCVVEYLGTRGIQVDAITLSNPQKRFISKLIKDKQLAHCKVDMVDFLELKATAHSYDAIFSLGSIEHLPNYLQVLNKCSALLRDGGYAYFDAAATDSTKLINSHFIEKYIFSGNHKCLDIHAFLNAVQNSDFELVCLHNDTNNYYLTLKTWAENLDEHKEEIVSRWKEPMYRKFQLYFWGCCYAMANNQLQAYRIVLRKKIKVGSC